MCKSEMKMKFFFIINRCKFIFDLNKAILTTVNQTVRKITQTVLYKIVPEMLFMQKI